MTSEKRLIDATKVYNGIALYMAENAYLNDTALDVLKMVASWLNEAPTVDAVEVEDKELLNAIKILVEQYSHSKRSDYVHSPVAHALYHTWKTVDKAGRRKERQ